MGMDVYGKNPTSETGKYFRRNVWGWHPLAKYCETVAPAITAKCEHWHSNDGDGLGASDSKALADVLSARLESGDVAADVTAIRVKLAALPDEPCTICAGTGRRLPPPQVGAGQEPCNGCHSTGKVRPWATHYGMDETDVREFVAFLLDCGGFEIL